MASSGFRERTRLAALGIATGLLAACAGRAPAPTRPPPAYEAGVDLPAGRGRDILEGSCLACHDLGGLDLFKGYYSRDSWRSLVLTMQANGAEIDGAEVETLADYLAQYFGPQTR